VYAWAQCVECGVDFAQKRSDHLCCSTRCSARQYRRRHPGVDTRGYRRKVGRVEPRDRRPWLILSAREARALELAAIATVLRSAQSVEPDLARALRQVHLQMQWIDGVSGSEAPDARAAVRRDKENTPVVSS
jgi:hypothetical protein